MLATLNTLWILFIWAYDLFCPIIPIGIAGVLFNTPKIYHCSCVWGKQMSRLSGLLCNMQQVPSLHPYTKGIPLPSPYFPKTNGLHFKSRLLGPSFSCKDCYRWIAASPINGAFSRSLPTMSYSLSSLCITSLSVSNHWFQILHSWSPFCCYVNRKMVVHFISEFVPFNYVIEISGNKRCFCSSNGCYKTLTQKPIFQQDWCPRYPRMLLAKFDWNWPSSSGQDL